MELIVNLNVSFLYHYYTKQIIQFCITYTWPIICEIGEILHFNTIFMYVKAMENINLILYKNDIKIKHLNSILIYFLMRKKRDFLEK